MRSNCVRDRPLTWVNVTTAVQRQPGWFSGVATVVATAEDEDLINCRFRFRLLISCLLAVEKVFPFGPCGASSLYDHALLAP
jgi:hypothetical protein